VGEPRSREREIASETLRKLQTVTDTALAHLSLDSLLNELLVRVRDVLEAETCAVLLLDEATNELVARAAKGIEEEVERGVRIPVGKGFAGRIADERRIIEIEDVDDSYVLNPILREKGIKSLLGAPLLANDRMLGVLHVGTLRPRKFTDDDVELLSIVAQRVALAVERALLYDEVVRLTELQRTFLQLAAHELRTPATSVYGLATTIRERRDHLEENKLWELFETLYDQSDRMRTLVEQLLDLSRVDAALVEVAPRRVELRSLVEEVVRSFAVERKEEIVLEVPQHIEATVDPNAFERVLGNLITNALRYGSPPVRVHVAPSDRHLRVAVEDAGPGVADEFVPFLFDRFRRSERSKARAKGSGLGLAIARAYARAHGGDVVYRPAQPHGARFELVLPLSEN
jgi:signal transduction histidine kinase